MKSVGSAGRRLTGAASESHAPALIRHTASTQRIMGNSGNAGKCNGCGKCLRKCPQKLDIVTELKKVKNEFEFPGVKYALSFVRHIGFPIYKYVVKILNL